MCDLTTGDIVECIDDLPRRGGAQILPVLGALYTITGIRTGEDGPVVRLKELTPDCPHGDACASGSCGWEAGRFRRVYRPRAELIASIKAALWPETV